MCCALQCNQDNPSGPCLQNPAKGCATCSTADSSRCATCANLGFVVDATTGACRAKSCQVGGGRHAADSGGAGRGCRRAGPCWRVWALCGYSGVVPTPSVPYSHLPRSPPQENFPNCRTCNPTTGACIRCKYGRRVSADRPHCQGAVAVQGQRCEPAF